MLYCLHTSVIYCPKSIRHVSP